MAKNDYISHSAHYSKNWDAQKQKNYNQWYYQQNKEKWANSAEVANVNKTRKEYAQTQQRANNANKLSSIYSGRAKNKWLNLLGNAKENGAKAAVGEAVDATKTAASYGLNAAKANNKNEGARRRFKKASATAKKAVKKDRDNGDNQIKYDLHLIKMSKIKAKHDRDEETKKRTDSSNAVVQKKAKKVTDKAKEVKKEVTSPNYADDWLYRTFGYKKKKKFNPKDYKQTRT